MSKSVDSANRLCQHLESLKNTDNYPEIYAAFQQNSVFRAPWANVISNRPLFRCRLHKECEKDIFFNQASLLGYNRASDSIPNYGRCNKPGQGVLYLSENRDTAMIETLQDKVENDICTITVSIWELRKTVNVFYVVQPNKEKRGHLYEQLMGDRYDMHVFKMLGEYPDYKEFSDIYLNYLNERSQSDEKGLTYQITAAYSNMAFNSTAKEDSPKSYGILYRSITQKDYFNVAFSSQIEDEDLIELKDVFKLRLRVKKSNPRNYDDFQIISIAKCEQVLANGNICWP